MSGTENFIQEVYQRNHKISKETAKSLKFERVDACKKFIKANPNLQSFFWVRNNLDFNIQMTYNTHDTLGISELNRRSSIRIIHPDHLNTFYKICLAVNKFCTSGKLGQSILNFTFIINLPMRDCNNQYWYLRQKSSACEINDHNQVLSFLSWHDIIRPYRSEPLTFQVIGNHGDRVLEIEEIIKEKSGYYQMLPFTKRQREILKIYIQNGSPDAEMVIQRIKISKDTLYTHNRDMLQRARQKFKQSFRDIFHLVDFLKRADLFG